MNKLHWLTSFKVKSSHKPHHGVKSVKKYPVSLAESVTKINKRMSWYTSRKLSVGKIVKN
ncbi:MAG: hypothetical protein D3913_13865 [Candidatus Electrothrix sp. LOE1_4_5]|nr:hypothetical protein [Candidatus Electrothrix gigas]MCI5178762.1 hypothetical protein [Candidatus Electrothrix gigas]MCI5192817.1 hypothetical protein [Candidatus Electrothrix gigas]